MDYTTVSLNSILATACIFGLCNLPIDSHPYAFCAFALGLTHAIMGMISAINEFDEGCTKAKQISTTIMEFAPLPLINIQLYKASSQSAFALCHAVFIIPLAYELIANLSDEEDPNTSALKHFTMMASISSLGYLNYLESNNLYGGIAAAVFISRYGTILLDKYFGGRGEPVTILANSAFFFLATEAIVGMWLK